MDVDAPTLLTDRLVLIKLGPDDLDEVAALFADPEVMRHVKGGVRTRPETADILATAERNWKRLGWGPWAIRDSTSGGLIGEGGLQPLDDVVSASVDFGYTLGRRHWDKGIATEAGQVILADGWTRYGGDVIHAVVHPDNTASRAVLRKLSFRRIDKRVIRGETQELWGLERPT